MTWIDVGAATVRSEDVKYVQDVQPAHGDGLAAGMKSVITLKSGGFIYARYARAVIVRKIQQAAPPAPGGDADGSRGQ